MGIRASSAKTVPSTALPAAITVTASPYSYQNTSNGVQSVIVSGGTVSLIEYTRDNATFFTVGVIAGAFDLNPLDRLRVTYAVLPTMTAIQVN
jgi:hypothetical protein